MKSVIQTEKVCYRCGSPYVEDHHIFFGNPNREHSEQYGLKIWLCHMDHRNGSEAPHRNRKVDLAYKTMAQTAFESKWGNRDDFIRIFGKSYL